MKFKLDYFLKEKLCSVSDWRSLPSHPPLPPAPPPPPVPSSWSSLAFSWIDKKKQATHEWECHAGLSSQLRRAVRAC